LIDQGLVDLEDIDVRTGEHREVLIRHADIIQSDVYPIASSHAERLDPQLVGDVLLRHFQDELVRDVQQARLGDGVRDAPAPQDSGGHVEVEANARVHT
jgi:hypothetical protein